MHLQDILKRYNIPTAAYEVFTDAQRAKDFIRSLGAPIVVKASGLAAGKGVVVARTVEEAYKAVDDMLVTKIFGNAGLWEPGGSRRYGRCPHFGGGVLHPPGCICFSLLECVFLCAHLPGDELVIEEFLEGEEASFFALVDGEKVVPLIAAQVR